MEVRVRKTGSRELITLRAAAPGDVLQLGRLGAKLVGVHHDFDARRFIAPEPGTHELYARFLGQQLARPNVVLLVAVQAERIGGYAFGALEGTDYMALRGPAGVLYDLFVDPDWRGKGIGRRLLDAAVAALGEGGAPRVLLSTAERNQAAQRLFAAAGFRPTMVEMTRELR